MCQLLHRHAESRPTAFRRTHFYNGKFDLNRPEPSGCFAPQTNRFGVIRCK